jgi:hypothetical protein
LSQAASGQPGAASVFRATYALDSLEVCVFVSSVVD